MRTSFFILCLMLALAGGCAKSTPTRYYLLESGLGPSSMDNLPKKTLRVPQVEAPAYLNRNNIVSRVQGETQLILADFHLWAEPVANGVRRVTQEILGRALPAKGISVLPSGSEDGGDYVLLLDLQRLDGNFNEKAVIECQWTLLDSRDNPVDRGVFGAEEMVNGADYNVLVSAESALVRALGNYLAERLPTLMRQR